MKQADLVVVGKITKVKNVMDGNAELAVGTITVSEVIKGDKDMKEVELAWRTGRVLDPNTGIWLEVRTSVDIRYSKGQEGIWALTGDPKNKDRFKAQYPGYPIKADEEKLREVRGYATEKYEHKEIPAKPVNGLLAEVKVLNSPLYPGDDIALDFRLTNVREKGEIQILDLDRRIGLASIIPKLITTDGKTPPWPRSRRGLITIPKQPSAVLQPRSFYGRKFSLERHLTDKPGRYSLSVEYRNIMSLKGEGFDFWTGKVQSNTVVFEVADVDARAKNGIKMLVKAKEKYLEGEPVIVQVRLYNSGEKEREVHIPGRFLLGYYSDGKVTDDKGKTIAWQRIQWNFRHLPPVKIGKLAPGKAFIETYDLRDYCRLNPGKFTFRLHGGVTKLGKLTSNEVSFEILKKEAPGSDEAPEKENTSER